MGTITTDYRATCQQIASIAATIIRLLDNTVTMETAVDRAAGYLIMDAESCSKRTAQYGGVLTAEDVEYATFNGLVARDIQDGEVTRPTTGNVREYTLNHLRSII